MAYSAAILAAIARLQSTYNGNAYNAGSNPGGLAAGGHRTNFVPALQDLANVASATGDEATAVGLVVTAGSLFSTSSSSVAIGLGTKNFTVETGKGWLKGHVAKIVDNAAPSTNYMVGSVDSYDSGTGAIQFNVTTIAGSGTIADWTITLNAPSSLDDLSDANGDVILSNGSFSAAGLDTDINAGGNRAVMDLINVSGVNWARLMAVPGGGSAVIVALSNGTSNLIVSDAGGNVKTIFGGNRVNGGVEYGSGNFGTFITSTYNIGWTDQVTAFGLLGGNPTINIQSPDTSYLKPYLLFLQQDGTGGRVPTFQRNGNTTQIKWLSAEPDWAGQPAWFGTAVSIVYSKDYERLWLSTPTLEDILS